MMTIFKKYSITVLLNKLKFRSNSQFLRKLDPRNTKESKSQADKHLYPGDIYTRPPRVLSN